MTRTLAENLANTLGYWRQTGQTTNLIKAAIAYGESHDSDVCIVTATEAYAERLRTEHGVKAKGVEFLHQSYGGKRNVLFLVDNHVLLQLGDEHRDLARMLEVSELGRSHVEAKLREAKVLRERVENDLAFERARSERLGRVTASLEKRLRDLQFVRSRRAKRKRKRRTRT